MLLKCCTQYVSKFGKSAVATGLQISVFIPVPKKGYARDYSNYLYNIKNQKNKSQINQELVEERNNKVEKRKKNRENKWKKKAGLLRSTTLASTLIDQAKKIR